jgi:hypothetical protein
MSGREMCSRGMNIEMHLEVCICQEFCSIEMNTVVSGGVYMSGNYCFEDVLRRNEYNTIEMYLEVCICPEILVLEMYSRGMNTILNRCV